MNLDNYFTRINYSGNTEPNIENLRAIHRAHMYHIPFENLSMFVPEPYQLNEEALFDKLVTRNRGGFCFEQNGLFAAILREMGYEVDILGAQVFNNERGTYSPSRTHMTLLVTAENTRYLADVGFGNCFIEALEFDSIDIQSQDVGDFKLEQNDNDTCYYMYSQNMGADIMKLSYRFELTPYELPDFEDALHYIITSPRSHFTHGRVCSMPNKHSRISLTEGKLIETTLNGERIETVVEHEDSFHELLETKFNIEVNTTPPPMPTL